MLKNKIKTLILISTLSLLFMAVGYFFGGRFGLEFALILALIFNLITYFYSDKIVLKIYDAHKLDKHKYADIYSMVNDLTNNMQLPMPKLYIIDTHMANAFATGRSPNHSSVAMTSGIINLLNQKELRAVISHELSHIKNRDMLVTTIAATIATAIGYLATMMEYAVIWGFPTNNGKRKTNIFAVIIIAILMPIAATLLQLAVSRSREYLADETGANYCHDPLALASALEKLDENIKKYHLEREDKLKATTSSLFIVNPFYEIDWATLFSTHPPIYLRIAKLKQIYDKMPKK